jgi:hypothetical protein
LILSSSGWIDAMRMIGARSHDNSPYYFGLVLLTAVVGFYPTYFSRLAEAGLLRHVHGGLAMAWLLLLVTQGLLARTGHFALHRTLGWASMVLVPLFLASGFGLLCDSLAGGNPFQEAFAPRLTFVDLIALGYFAFCYAMAIRHRKHRPLHARYMASTAVLVLPPALARALGFFMPGISSFEAAFHAAMAISALVVVVLIVRDLREGRLRLPYPLLLAVLVVQDVGFELVADWAAWQALCARMAALAA